MDTTRCTRIVFSGIKPTGEPTLGSYVGALRRFVALQDAGDSRCIFPVVDLHALTVEHSPGRLRELTREVAMLYLAAGLDPRRSVLFEQSDVPAHTELTYLLECTAYVGELSRMIQYKEKGRGRPRTRTSLMTYPVLMAADILLYGTTHVPVGDDQKQHLELTRDLALRFNRSYGEVFVIPEMVHATVAARVMDLQDPTRKMSKSVSGLDQGAIRLLDPPDVVRRKVMRAVTDTETSVRYDPENKPGVSNLLDILGACLDTTDLGKLAAEYDSHGASYGALKRDVADAVISLITPLQKRYDELAAEPSMIDDVLRTGAEHARDLAAPVLRAARHAIGVG